MIQHVVEIDQPADPVGLNHIRYPPRDVERTIGRPVEKRAIAQVGRRRFPHVDALLAVFAGDLVPRGRTAGGEIVWRHLAEQAGVTSVGRVGRIVERVDRGVGPRVQKYDAALYSGFAVIARWTLKNVESMCGKFLTSAASGAGRFSRPTIWKKVCSRLMELATRRLARTSLPSSRRTPTAFPFSTIIFSTP